MENIWQRRHPDDLQWTPNIVKGGGALSSGSVVLDDLWSRKIWKPKMIVWSPVLHSSLDDHVLTEYACLFYNIGTLTWVIWKTEDTKIGKKESESAELFQNHTIGPMGGVQCQYMIKHHGHKYSPSLEGHPAGKKESRKSRDFWKHYLNGWEEKLIKSSY